MPRAILLALLLLSGCSNVSGGQGGDARTRGAAALEAGDPRTARIELLNAIKARPADPVARVLQARAYLALGQGAAAEAELVRARAVGAGRAATGHLMAHALLLQQRPEAALVEAEHATVPVYAARMRGRALMALGDPAAAAAEFDQALASASTDAAAWTDMARFRRSVGEIGGAIAAVDGAIALKRDDVEALTLRGELTRGQYGLAAALPWFDRALEVRPDDETALLERAATLGELGRMAEMLAATRKILSLSPENAMAFYLQAVLAARAGDFALARALYARTGNALDRLPAAMLLDGAVALGSGDDERAVERLTRLTSLQPDNQKARRLLALAQWRSGDLVGAAETLRPIADRGDADAYSLALMGRIHAAAGDGATAAYLARAARPQAFVEAPFAEGGAAADVRLVRRLVGEGSFAVAVAEARRIEASHPGAPDAHLLAGDALAAAGDHTAAAEAYRAAANLAFTEPVALRLVEALSRSGQPRAAAQVLQLFLGQNPRSVAALTLAADRYVAAGDWDRAIGAYRRIRREIGDRDAALLANLARAYAEKADLDRAILFARKAHALDPRHPAAADTLGWLLFKSGRDRVRGLVLLQQAARGAPDAAAIERELEAARRGAARKPA